MLVPGGPSWKVGPEYAVHSLNANQIEMQFSRLDSAYGITLLEQCIKRYLKKNCGNFLFILYFQGSQHPDSSCSEGESELGSAKAPNFRRSTAL